MGTKKPTNNAKIGAVRERTQTFNPKTGLWVKKDTETGLFIENKVSGGKFKGVRKESLSKMATTLNKLAQYDKGK